MKLVCKMISTVDYHVFGYEITMYYYAIHWELSFVRYIGAVHWGRYGRGLAMKLAMTDRGQPPLFMAYWLWAAVYLFVVVADAVAAGPGVPLNFALCMPAALAAVPAVVAGAAASTVEAAVEAVVDGACEADVAAATEAWCDAFSEEFRAQHRQDRRCSNSGGHKAEDKVARAPHPRLPSVRTLLTWHPSVAVRKSRHLGAQG